MAASILNAKQPPFPKKPAVNPLNAKRRTVNPAALLHPILLGFQDDAEIPQGTKIFMEGLRAFLLQCLSPFFDPVIFNGVDWGLGFPNCMLNLNLEACIRESQSSRMA